MSGHFLDIIREIVKEAARAEIQQQDIMNKNGADLAYIDKANLANVLGLSDQQKLGVTPFPSPQNTAINIGGGGGDDLQSPPPIPKQTKSKWPMILGSAVLGSALTAGGIALPHLLKPREPNTQANTQPDQEPGIGQVGIKVEGW